jgi:hypothetical protein
LEKLEEVLGEIQAKVLAENYLKRQRQKYCILAEMLAEVFAESGKISELAIS